MELALWANIRVMEKSAYFGVYCRRWGIPLLMVVQLGFQGLLEKEGQWI